MDFSLLNKLYRKTLKSLEEFLEMALEQVAALNLIFTEYRKKNAELNQALADKSAEVATLSDQLIAAQSDDEADEAAKVELAAQRDKALADFAAYKELAEANLQAESQEDVAVEGLITQELDFLGINPEPTPDPTP